MQSGIYIITNIESQNFYIGSTIDFRRRQLEHVSSLNLGKHGNPHLQRAWNKYGESAFEFGILEYLDNPEELHLAEQFWMDIYREEKKSLYNCGLFACSPLLGYKRSEKTRLKTSSSLRGHKHSEETKHKISATLTGRTVSEAHKLNMSRARGRPYPSFINRDTGEVIPPGNNLSKLCQEMELNESAMCGVKNGKRLSYKGWILGR